MNARIVTSLLGVLVLAFSISAGAATISLQPSAALVPQSTTFTVNLFLNAGDAPGSHPGLYGGQILIDFNPALITYNSFALASGLSFFSNPVVGSANGHRTVTLGFDNATDTGRVGTFNFTAIGAPGGIATIGLADADNFFGTFVTYTPTYQAFYPAFNGTSIQVSAVPLPGTAVMFLTAFAAAGWRRCRS